MARDLTRLSIEEIRTRFVDAGAPVSPQLLTKLKKDPRQGVRRIYEVLRRRHAKERDERLRMDGMLHFERVLWKSGVKHVAGVDEAGMGPLAGPVVAAAVVFPPGCELPGVDDSKRLDPARRARLAEAIHREAAGVGVGEADVAEIDRLNIYRASLVAMQRALDALPMKPEHVLVDAHPIPDVSVPQNTFQKGDGLDYSIAAASIVAKTHRDALMEELDRRHPGYGLARHKGYSTAEHQAAIRRLGPSPAHRRSFAVIDELCGEYSALYYELRARLDGAVARAALQRFEQELEAHREALSEAECRKLRIVLGRRWKLL